MTPLQIVLCAIAVLVVLLVAIVLVRTLNFKPKKIEIASSEKVKIDEKKVVEHFQTLLRFKTITVTDVENGDYTEFEKLIEYIQKTYVNVFKACEFERVDKLGLVLKLKGKSSENSSVLMSHYDVVPVVEANWATAPFDAVIKDGRIFARGALDNKATMLCGLEGLEGILAKNPNFKPEFDLYFTFGGNEETSGASQQAIVAKFKKENVRPHLVLDEGGAIVKNIFPGVSEDIAVVGLAEKGVANLELTVVSGGGHASTPSKNNPVNVLARALVNIEKHPMKPFIVPPIAQMCDTLGRHSKFALKLVFANMWLFKGLVKKLFTVISTETNAMLTTTFAYTVLEGSNAHNVLPAQAKANLNTRIANNHDLDMVIAHLKKVINDDRVTITPVMAYNPSPMAAVDGFAFKTVERVLNEVYPEVIVSPYVMLAASDSRFYGEISSEVLKFAPFKMTKEQRGSIHGNNENIEISTLIRGVEFYNNLILKL
ncbi:MAG: M20/M25/M40 family metallo-hydrolase [Clostridia bacterium]